MASMESVPLMPLADQCVNVILATVGVRAMSLDVQVLTDYSRTSMTVYATYALMYNIRIAAVSCLSGGTCNVQPTDDLCTCPPGYHGLLCEKNLCQNFPCSGHGTCSLVQGKPYCR